MYKIHARGWTVASKEEINRFLYLQGYPAALNVKRDFLDAESRDKIPCRYTLSPAGLILSDGMHNGEWTTQGRPMSEGFQRWALEACILGKTELEWVLRDSRHHDRNDYYAFVPTTDDEQTGFVLQAVCNHAWKGKPESFEFAIYAVSCDRPVDVSTINPALCMLHVPLDGLTYLDQAAPMIEAEKALKRMFNGGLEQLKPRA